MYFGERRYFETQKVTSVRKHVCKRNTCCLGLLLLFDWDAAFLGALPEDPGTSGYPANCGVSGGARSGRFPQKVASRSIGSLGDIYFTDTGSLRAKVAFGNRRRQETEILKTLSFPTVDDRGQVTVDFPSRTFAPCSSGR